MSSKQGRELVKSHFGEYLAASFSEAGDSRGRVPGPTWVRPARQLFAGEELPEQKAGVACAVSYVSAIHTPNLFCESQNIFLIWQFRSWEQALSVHPNQWISLSVRQAVIPLLDQLSFTEKKKSLELSAF